MGSEPKVDIGDVPVGVICWHIRHKELLGITTKPLSQRVEFIRARKSKRQIPVRLRRMRPVWGELSEGLLKAAREYTRAQKAYWRKRSRTMRERWCDARNAWDKAVKRNQRSLRRLHDKECPGCPWDWDQGTLFPRAE
jgi:hypothetical protein